MNQILEEKGVKEEETLGPHNLGKRCLPTSNNVRAQGITHVHETPGKCSRGSRDTGSRIANTVAGTERDAHSDHTRTSKALSDVTVNYIFAIGYKQARERESYDLTRRWFDRESIGKRVELS